MQVPLFARLISIVLFTNLLAAQEILDSRKTVGLALMSNIEMRKAQKSDLEKTREEYKKRAEESEKSITTALAKINLELSETQQKIRRAQDQEAEYLNKIEILLNDRKQNLIDFKDQWREYLENIDQHITLLTATIDFFKAPKQELKAAYAWKEFREAQMRIAEHTSRIENEKIKRDNLKKQRTATNELLNSLEKQQTVKQKERKKLITQYNAKDKDSNVSSQTFKLQADVISQEINALEERIEHEKITALSLDFGIKLWDDVIELEQNKLLNQKGTLTQIEGRLILDYNDVDIAKSDWKIETQNALTTKEQLNEQKEPKKQAREKAIIELDFLREKRTKIKTKNSDDKTELFLTKAHIKQYTALIKTLEKELALLDLKKDLSDIRANEKELQYNMVELRYKLRIEDAESLNELLTAFQNKHDLAASALRALKDRRTESITHLIETNRSIDKINSQQELFRSKKNILIKNSESTWREIQTSLDEAKKHLSSQLNTMQAILAVNADLITHQEKIINQYDLIIAELEGRVKMFGVWKRSPRAISLHSLGLSLVEAETFFKKLYWETPNQLRPSTFFTFIKTLTWGDYFLLLICIIFYCVGLFFLRLFLRVAQTKLSGLLHKYQGHARYLYISLALAITEFALNHFILLFTWLYILLHIIFDFQYIFSALEIFASNYSIAIFYLISMPILAYLSHAFIVHLKELNRKLSYLFFAETFQDKFIFLVTIFCYATAMLIPLKSSFLAYTQESHAEFTTLILAAYSLILILVLLFFFSKDDILKFVPSNTTFLIWLKRKIDKHYYPVFIFIMGLFILSNPYVGYSNLAWFLAFAVPASSMLMYLLFIAHHFIRKYALFIFMKEDEDEIIDKFEHAKAYYGFFVIFSFLVLLFAFFILILHIWGFDHTPTDLYRLFAEQWTIRVGLDSKLGLIEILTIGLFIAVAFLISSLLHKFMLNRLFDILRTEPGTQNTISRILHYSIIFLSILLGLNAINLGQFIFWVGAPFGIVLGLALKDIVSDLVSGFFVLIERPIEIGNYIQIDDIQGTVHKIAPRSTTIITSRNHSIIIPNKDLVTKWISNWGHGRFAVGFEIAIRVDHQSDADLVKRTLITVVQSNQFVLKVPAIVVRLEDIEQDALYFLVRAFISARRVKEQWEIAATLRMEMLKAFRENKIKLSMPSRMLYGSGNDGSGQPRAVEIRFDK